MSGQSEYVAQERFEQHLRAIAGQLPQVLPALKAHLAQQPTWLDRCAWAALNGALSNSKLGVVTSSKLAEESYKVAEAMLTEKQRRDGAGGAK